MRLYRPRASQTRTGLWLSILLSALGSAGCGAGDLPPAEPPEAAEPLGETGQHLTVTLQPGPEGKDARLFSRSDQVNTPSPDGRALYGLAWTYSGTAAVMRGLLDFDIPARPSGTSLVRATLVLSADTTSTSQPIGHSQLSGSNAWRLLQVTSPWSESTVTWNTQPSTDTATSILLPASTSNSQTYSIDVTQHVAREQANPSAYHGWLLKLETEQYYRAVQFASSDHPTASLRPRLVLEYTDPVATATLSGRVTRGSCTSNCGLANVRVDAGSRSTTTGADGSYVLSGLSPGTYTVRATLSGWSFGSLSFQNTNYTRTLSAGQTATVNITGWNLDPVVFVHGWNSSVASDFEGVPAALRAAGYFVHDTGVLDTSFTGTPPLHVNADRVRQWVQAAKNTTGRSKVILYGQSMGGLVARAYLEGSSYGGDVSQIFTFGSPHLGVPLIMGPGCPAEVVAQGRPGAICNMTPAGMALFNLTHFKRSGVDYHLTAGDAPMWTQKRLCFRLFRRNICVASIPWPTFDFRNAAGWAMGVVIAGRDDGFIRTSSASGQPGFNIDRFITREVHTATNLGPRDYHEWNGGLSQEGYAQCARRILIDRNTTTCGSRIWPGPPPGSFLRAPGTEAGATQEAMPLAAVSDEVAAPALQQSSRISSGVIQAAGRRVQTVIVEGGATSFTAQWEQGSARFTLIDPAGQVIDPAYASAQTLDPSSPEAQTAEQVTEADPEVAVYQAEGTRASYYFPSARPGTWQLVLEGGSDLPSSGTRSTTQALFEGPLEAKLNLARLYLEPNQTTRLAVGFSEPVLSASVQVKVTRPGGAEQLVTLQRVSATEYAADYLVPGPSGYATLEWSVTGQRADGVAFERGGLEHVQFNSASVRLGTGHTDRAIAGGDFIGLDAFLAVSLRVSSDYSGQPLGVFAELVAPDGRVISSTMTAVPSVVGTNTVELRFPAADLYAARADGPYTIRNVRLLDMRGAPLLSQEVALAHTTALYRYTQFAPQPSIPSVFLGGPFNVLAGSSVQLTATGADPEGQALSFAWDLNADGVYEASGASVLFTTSSQEPPGLRTVRVRVTDTSGNTATAQGTVEVFANRAPVVLCRNVTVLADSTCRANPSVNDGSYDPDTGTHITCVQTPGGPYTVGSRQVMLTCTDAGGLSSSCSATVTVKSPPSSPGTVTLQPGPEGKDARLFSRPDQVDVPSPDGRALFALGWTYSGTPAVMRGLLDFDIPAAPQGATLAKATLVLSADTTSTQEPIGHSQLTGTNEWRLLQVTSPWSESTATWNNQPSTDAATSIALPASTSNSQAYSINVTAHVARELANPSAFHGWLLKLETEDYYRAIQFASGDHPTAALRPRLVLEYSMPQCQ